MMLREALVFVWRPSWWLVIAINLKLVKKLSNINALVQFIFSQGYSFHFILISHLWWFDGRGFLLLGSQIWFLGFLADGTWGLLCGDFKYFGIGAFYIRRINLGIKMVQPAHSIIVMLIMVPWLFVLRLLISSELSLSGAVTLSVSPPDIYDAVASFHFN